MSRIKTRQSGIELLRIVAMLGIVLLHYNDGKGQGFASAVTGSAQFYVLFLLESMAICGVDLFLIISGYFSSKSQKRSFLKPLELIFQLIVFHEIRYVIRALLSGEGISVKSLIVNLVPANYFIILFCALYLISPYVNVVLNKLDAKQWKRFLGLCIVLFSVWNTLVDLSQEILGSQWNGLSTIGSSGSQQGFNLVNFLLMYVVGAYLGHCEIPRKLERKRVLIPAWVGTVCLIFAWALLCQKLHLNGLRSAWVYHNPLVILSAVLLFLLFRQFTFQSKLVNHLASASFTCYLTHQLLLDYVGIEFAVHAGVAWMMLHIALVIPCIYLVSYVVYLVYDFLTGWLFKLLAKREFFQTREVLCEIKEQL